LYLIGGASRIITPLTNGGKSAASIGLCIDSGADAPGTQHKQKDWQAMALQADYMLSGGTVITVDGERRIFRDGAVAFRGSDIVAVGKREELERSVDAKKVMEVLGRGFERFGLKLHPEKTRLLPFHRPSSGDDGSKGPATFDFLGFTLYWRKTRAGRWMPAFKTRKAGLARPIQAVHGWCRRYRHKPVKEQHATLKKKLVGHYNYFGVNGNTRSLATLLHKVKRSWRAWLSRRSQRGHISWARFTELLRRFPLPTPHIRVQIWSFVVRLRTADDIRANQE